MMRRLTCLLAALFVFMQSAYAKDLLDWLEEMPAVIDDAAAVTDLAELLTLESRETEMYPRVSPDGKYMLVVSGKRNKPVISRRLLENGDPMNIVSDSDQQVLDSISWLDNELVTFFSYRADSLGLWKKSAEGGVVRRQFRRLDGDLRSPVVLPDGSLIAVRLNDSYGRVHTVRVHMDSGPDKAAKGKKIRTVFENWKFRGQTPHLVSISPEGAEKELTAGVNPSLSPDGKRLVFSMQEGHDYHLFMMNVDGSDLVRLTDGPGVNVQPAWSPDGERIAFSSNRISAGKHKTGKSNWDIWVIGRDGKGLTRLTHDSSRDGAPSIAGNGRVYFHSDRKVSKETRKSHQVRGSTGGFHIWSVALPAEAG